MVRPLKKRMIEKKPESDYFKPRGIPMSLLKESVLTIDETEAVRLADFLGMSHEKAGENMGVSRQTFGRIIQKARNKIADAIINGKAIKIEGGHYEFSMPEKYHHRAGKNKREFMKEKCRQPRHKF
ncbi:MAG: hypothetical protein CSA18_00855 [Deltaproteobacteria bacterium]|nr:MAG: hypothetical protein CSA18_00855 [Deltaproteobacteria bacterium]